MGGKWLFHDENGRECSVCHQIKTWVSFPKQKSGVNGKRADCNDCCRKKWREQKQGPEQKKKSKEAVHRYIERNPEKWQTYHRERSRQPRGRAIQMWHGMKDRCKNESCYKHVEVRMTKQEWFDWAIPRIEQFMLAYPDESPSVDRIDPEGHYQLDNLQIISWKANWLRSRFISHKFIKQSDPMQTKLENLTMLAASLSCNLYIEFDTLVKTLKEVNEAMQSLPDRATAN